MIYVSTGICAPGKENIVNGIFNKLLAALKDWMAKKLADCRDITPTIGESIDRKISLWDRWRVRLHLFTCDRCRRYLKHVRFLRHTLRQHGEKIADPEQFAGTELRCELKDRMKQLLLRESLTT